MKVSTRKAEINDAKEIARLSAQFGYASETSTVQKRLSQILHSSEHGVFVAVEKEAIVGWIHAYYATRVESDPFVEIGGLVVDENCRLKGIGKTLVDEVTRWAGTRECLKIRVRCNSIRKETHLFYEKLGFIQCKEQIVFDRHIKKD